MCFYSTSSKLVKAKIAKEDIIVFKKLCKSGTNKYTSYFKFFRYNKKGKPYPKVNLQDHVGFFSSIHKGYHSWSWKKFKYKEDDLTNESYPLCLFMIPKGTKYYSNNNNELVSETIVFIGEI